MTKSKWTVLSEKKRVNKAIQSLQNWKQFLEIQKELVLFLNWQLRSRHSICRRFYGRLISTLRSSLAKSIMLEIFTGNIFYLIFFKIICDKTTFYQLSHRRKNCSKIRVLFLNGKKAYIKTINQVILVIFSIVEISNKFLLQ